MSAATEYKPRRRRVTWAIADLYGYEFDSWSARDGLRRVRQKLKEQVEAVIGEREFLIIQTGSSLLDSGARFSCLSHFYPAATSYNKAAVDGDR